MTHPADHPALRELRTLRAQRAELEALWVDAIVEARQDGLPVRVIADAAGISPQTVLNIVDRFTEETQP